MPRHPPIALKTLDRSHCQYPSARPRGIVARARSCAGSRFNGIGTKRPASRDRFEGAVRQTHHMREIERLPRQITTLTAHEVRTNLLFTMSNRTGGKARCSPQTLFSNDFAPSVFISTQHQGNGGAGRDRTDDILLAKQALSQLSYGPLLPLRSDVEEMVGLGGLEPPTSRLSSARSNQLSYKP